MSKAKKSDGLSLVDQLAEAKFESAGNGTYSKGGNRVEVSFIPGEKGPVEEWKFYQGDDKTPVFHTNAQQLPSEEFMAEFLK